jgi:GNAT superfamily N-acetyltransferase
MVSALTEEIKKATAIEQIQKCFHVVQQLRPHLQEKSFIEQVQRQIGQGYQLVYLETEEAVRAVAGYRFLEFLAWGKVLYLDDLITDLNARRKGYASALLKWVISQAKIAECAEVHLDSGPQRHDAHRLYLNHGFQLNSHHFALRMLAKT